METYVETFDSFQLVGCKCDTTRPPLEFGWFWQIGSPPRVTCEVFMRRWSVRSQEFFPELMIGNCQRKCCRLIVWHLRDRQSYLERDRKEERDQINPNHISLYFAMPKLSEGTHGKSQPGFRGMKRVLFEPLIKVPFQSFTVIRGPKGVSNEECFLKIGSCSLIVQCLQWSYFYKRVTYW